MPATHGPGLAPSDGERHTAWLLVLGQFSLLALIVLAPRSHMWTVPVAVDRVTRVAAGMGIVVMLIAGATLGRGLTAAPLPNSHAGLRTRGLYRLVRHPIYSGLLLLSLALTLTSGSLWILSADAALVVLINVKARWEEGHLERRFTDYAAYAARTPRFLPRLVHHH